LEHPLSFCDFCIDHAAVSAKHLVNDRLTVEERSDRPAYVHVHCRSEVMVDMHETVTVTEKTVGAETGLSSDALDFFTLDIKRKVIDFSRKECIDVYFI
jgi:hypothetical protein